MKLFILRTRQSSFLLSSKFTAASLSVLCSVRRKKNEWDILFFEKHKREEGGSGNLGSKRSIDGGACAIWFDIQISSAPPPFFFSFFLSLRDKGLMDVISSYTFFMHFHV